MSRKDKLAGLLGQRPAAPVQPAAQPTARPAPALYQLSEQVALPAEAQALSAPVQELARQLIATRRRIGRELLEAARIAAAARAQCEHGDWLVFLQVTGTGEDTAERLLNIYERAAALPSFEEAISGGRLTESAAWRLARPSTPPALVDTVLTQRDLTVRAIERALRTARAEERTAEEQIPPRGGISAGQAAVVQPLTAADRAAVTRLRATVAAYLHDPASLTPDDWAALEPLAAELAQLRTLISEDGAA